MRSSIAKRVRSSSQSINTVPPARDSQEYDASLAQLAKQILYLNPLPTAIPPSSTAPSLPIILPTSPSLVRSPVDSSTISTSFSSRINTAASPTSTTDAGVQDREQIRELSPSDYEKPLYILNGDAFPDVREISAEKLLPYILAQLPSEEELIVGKGYEIVFFAGGDPSASASAGTPSGGGRVRGGTFKRPAAFGGPKTAEHEKAPGGDMEGSGDVDGGGGASGGRGKGGTGGARGGKKARPGWAFFMQAYSALTRATRKRLQRLWIVHERQWVRVLMEMFSTGVSPKFRRKVVHCEFSLSLTIVLWDKLRKCWRTFGRDDPKLIEFRKHGTVASEQPSSLSS